MLYSHNLENEKLNLFVLFLTRASNGEKEYASIVNDVIFETHKYVAGEKDLYNISRDSMNIILMLAGLEKEYFKSLGDSPTSYDKGTYSKVLEIIKHNQLRMVY